MTQKSEEKSYKFEIGSLFINNPNRFVRKGLRKYY